MKRRNSDIRERIEKAGLHHWQIAYEIGVAPSTLVQWLRVELSEDRRNKILNAIDKLTKEGDEG